MRVGAKQVEARGKRERAVQLSDSSQAKAGLRLRSRPGAGAGVGAKVPIKASGERREEHRRGIDTIDIIEIVISIYTPINFFYFVIR